MQELCYTRGLGDLLQTKVCLRPVKHTTCTHFDAKSRTILFFLHQLFAICNNLIKIQIVLQQCGCCNDTVSLRRLWIIFHFIFPNLVVCCFIKQMRLTQFTLSAASLLSMIQLLCWIIKFLCLFVTKMQQLHLSGTSPHNRYVPVSCCFNQKTKQALNIYNSLFQP